MKTEERRAIQLPLKDHYREAPAAALATLKAQGRVGEEISCKIETGKALVACAEVKLAAGATVVAAFLIMYILPLNKRSVFIRFM